MGRGRFELTEIKSACARALRIRTARFLFSCSLVPLFFCVPLLSRCCPASCPGGCPGLTSEVLIFRVITNGYDEAACPAVCLDHCLGSQPGKEPVDGRFRHAPGIPQLANGAAELPATDLDCLALDVELRRLPARAPDHPEPRSKALRVLRKEGVLKRLAVHEDEAAHAGFSPRDAAMRSACRDMRMFPRFPTHRKPGREPQVGQMMRVASRRLLSRVGSIERLTAQSSSDRKGFPRARSAARCSART